MTEQSSPGAHWRTLVAPPPNGGGPGDDGRRLERALAAAGAVAWEWEVNSGQGNRSTGTASLLSIMNDPARSFFDLVHPADRDWLRAAISGAVRGERAYNFEFRLLAGQGRIEWVHDQGQLERDTRGRPLRLAGVAQIITARKRTESAFGATFEQAAMGMAHVALNGAFLNVNPSLCRMLGRPREVLLSLGFQDVTHPDDLAAELARMDDLRAGRIANHTMEKRYIRGDGAVVWGRLAVSLVRDVDDEPDYVISLVEDISDRVMQTMPHGGGAGGSKLIAALATREAQLARVQRIGRIGGFEVDLRSSDFWAQPSPEYRALHALTPDVENEPHQAWLARLHPDDRARADATLRAAISSGAFRYNNEYRIVLPHGETRWIAATGEIDRDPAGQPLRLIGVHQDITERKSAEAALSESEAFATSILIATSDCIAVLDAENRLEYMNEPGRSQVEIDDLSQVTGRPVLSLWPEESAPLVRAAMDTARVSGVASYTAFGPTAKGTPKWWDVTLSLLPPNEKGRSRLLSVARDITDRKQAETALAETARDAGERLGELEAVYATAPVGLAVLTPDMRFLRINERLAEINGISAEAHTGRTVREVVPDLAGRAEKIVRHILETGQPVLNVEFTGETTAQPGVRRTWIESLTPVRGPDGKIAAINVVAEDITERRAAEARQRRLLQLIERSNDFVGIADLDGRLNYINAGGRRMIGLDGTAEIGDLHLSDYVAPDSLELFHKIVIPTARELGFWGGEMRLVNPSTGIPREVYRAIFALRDPDGSINGFGSVIRDITGTKRAMAALAESEAFTRSVLEASPDCLKVVRFDGQLEYMNQNGARLLEIDDCTAILGRNWEELWPDSQAQTIRDAIAAAREGRTFRFSASAPTAKGTLKYWDVAVTPIPGPDGRPIKLVAASRDITGKIHAETALLDSGALLRATYAAASVGLALVDKDLRFVHVNDHLAAINGISASEQIGRTVREVLPFLADRLEPLYRSVLETGVPIRDLEITEETVAAPGVRRSLLASYNPLHGPDGIKGVSVSIVEITARKAAEAALAESEARLRRLNEELETRVAEEVAAREEAQIQLAHVQRMEALGQLAGGIAHDFNNVLQAVGGGAALIMRRPEEKERVRSLARMMIEAVERGSGITRRLLYFSRRADLRAEPVDALVLLTDMREILTRTLGDGIDVQVEVWEDVPPLMADKGQLETVLINLATNGRDAMNGLGKLTLRATTEIIASIDGPGRPPGLQVGNYIRLSVSDTGAGMDATTLARATEPFFTTKPHDKGTGLGLAMANGFVQQSGGDMRIDSVPGRGTTVSLWLPVSRKDAIAADRDTGDTGRPPGETPTRLMLVEDDPLVRDILARQMEEAGHIVIAVDSVDAALARLDVGEAVDVIVSDLSMPDANGVTFIREAQRRRPGLPAILLTGFATSQAEIAIGSAVGGTFTLLRKPIAGHVLAERVAVLLEGRSVGQKPGPPAVR